MRRVIYLALAITILISAPAWAGTIGPVYPPPGGVTFASSPIGVQGAAGKAGGLTWSYSNLNPSAYSELFWGLSVLGAPSNVFGATSPATGFSLSGNVATFTFANPWFIDLSGFPDRTHTVRYTATASTGTWTSGNSGPVQGVWLPVTGTSFSITHLFEANVSGVWIPVNDYYNGLQGTPSNGQVRTSIGGGFWYSVPESGSAGSLLAGMAAITLFASILGLPRSW